MAEFWVIYERQENQAFAQRGNEGEARPPGTQYSSTSFLVPREAETGGVASWSGQPELAKIVKVKVSGAGATGIAEAQTMARGLFQGACTDIPIVVAAAQFKTA